MDDSLIISHVENGCASPTISLLNSPVRSTLLLTIQFQDNDRAETASHEIQQHVKQVIQ